MIHPLKHKSWKCITTRSKVLRGLEYDCVSECEVQKVAALNDSMLRSWWSQLLRKLWSDEVFLQNRLSPQFNLVRFFDVAYHDASLKSFSNLHETLLHIINKQSIKNSFQHYVLEFSNKDIRTEGTFDHKCNGKECFLCYCVKTLNISLYEATCTSEKAFAILSENNTRGSYSWKYSFYQQTEESITFTFIPLTFEKSTNCLNFCFIVWEAAIFKNLWNGVCGGCIHIGQFNSVPQCAPLDGS